MVEEQKVAEGHICGREFARRLRREILEVEREVRAVDELKEYDNSAGNKRHDKQKHT
jgi:hypothetical protein